MVHIIACTRSNVVFKAENVTPQTLIRINRTMIRGNVSTRFSRFGARTVPLRHCRMQVTARVPTDMHLQALIGVMKWSCRVYATGRSRTRSNRGFIWFLYIVCLQKGATHLRTCTTIIQLQMTERLPQLILENMCCLHVKVKGLEISYDKEKLPRRRSSYRFLSQLTDQERGQLNFGYVVQYLHPGCSLASLLERRSIKSVPILLRSCHCSYLGNFEFKYHTNSPLLRSFCVRTSFSLAFSTKILFLLSAQLKPTSII